MFTIDIPIDAIEDMQVFRKYNCLSVIAIGKKEGNRLYIRGVEYKL